jgi:hypothetical protein
VYKESNANKNKALIVFVVVPNLQRGIATLINSYYHLPATKLRIG